MSKLFKVGGVTKGKSGYKVRFANDMTRVKILSKTETDITLIDLPQAMSKAELVTFLKSHEIYHNASYKEAIDNADVKYNNTKVVSVKAEKVKPSLDAIKARATKQTVAE